ncbi:dihydrofolate reductase [Putridiphycobacter roseus]|uniref:Dihydrofolate reductase n=1 Tax=Putridiphycobacter roseus TaxID=2219161 RepID=A0A2W1NL21_9FLAO|nr:dihydrofolate reductase [Putridiphycobacter roseus]PZE16362.1 dihydrofolate reductase [Putridiphycobacter roseus]
MSKVKLIVAKGENNEIGKDNDLIWHLPADMRFFTQTTKNHVVIMGRKNWDSIPLKYRPLSNRINAVVTHNKAFSHADCDTFHSVEDAIAHYKKEEDKEIFIIGGAQIYKYCLDHNLVDEMLITCIKESFDADAFFPTFDQSSWTKEMIMDYKMDEKNKYDFTVYRFEKK